MHRHPHILNAATTLLGICFVIIGGLKLTGQNPKSYSDELAWLAAASFFASILVSYSAIRADAARPWQTQFADLAFIGGIFALLSSMVVGAVFL
ncbi:MAG TPA: hypothetical protein VMC10_09535 [Stellaceae bacterium]|nr:hypothetical protein [Stellaceae bacterium]